MKFLTPAETETFTALEQEIDDHRIRMVEVGRELIRSAVASRRDALSTGAAMTEPGGALTTLVGTITDIHERLLEHNLLHPDTVDFIINSED